MKKAESLDPLSLIINADLAEPLVLAHSYDESIRQSRKTIEMDPNFALAHNQLGQAYLQKHMYDEAVAKLKKAVQLSGGSPTFIANLARAYVASGNRSEAVRLLSDLKKRSNPGYSNASEMAMIYASLGDADQATNWLDKGYEERFNPGVLLRPGFDPLRSDRASRTLCTALAYPGEICVPNALVAANAELSISLRRPRVVCDPLRSRREVTQVTALLDSVPPQSY